MQHITECEDCQCETAVEELPLQKIGLILARIRPTILANSEVVPCRSTMECIYTVHIRLNANID